MTERRLLTLLLACVWPMIGACSRGPATLGVLLPLSGPSAERGQQVRSGIDLAVKEWTAEHGSVAVNVLDNQGSPAETARLYDQLVESGASAVIGPLSGECVRAAGVLARAGQVPTVVPGAAGADLTADNPWVFRFGFTDEDAASALAAFARYDLDLTRMGVLVDLNRVDSVALTQTFTDEFQRHRGRVVIELGYWGDRDPDELSRVLDDVLHNRVDGVLIAGRGPDVRRMILGADPALLAEVVLLGGDGWQDEALRRSLQGKVVGAFHATHFSPDEINPESRAFVESYRRAYGTDPTSDAALGYDTARAVLAAFDPTGDGGAMVGRLAAIRRFEGATGRITIDADGGPARRSVGIVQHHDSGRPAFVRRVEP